jgi:hypothetical protein
MASPNVREAIEGKQYQGEDEVVVYTYNVANVGSTPSSPVVVVKDANTLTDVTATVMPTNSPSVSGEVITLSPLRALTAGTEYRVEIKYTLSGNTLENYFLVVAQE